MALELFLDLSSQPCRALYIFAKRNKIPFEFRLVELIKGASHISCGFGQEASIHQDPEHRIVLENGQHRGEDFLKVNPDGKVPAMRDGGFALAESIAILLYLVRKHRTPDHWYPSDLQKRARVDEYLSWQHTGTRHAGTKVFLIKALLPLFLGHPLPEDKLAAAIKDLDEVLAFFEEKFLGEGRPFIAGSQVSLADLVALVELMQPVAVGHDLFASRPKMAAWRARVEEAVGKELFQEAHKPLFDAKDAKLDHLPPALKEQVTGLLLKFIG